MYSVAAFEMKSFGIVGIKCTDRKEQILFDTFK